MNEPRWDGYERGVAFGDAMEAPRMQMPDRVMAGELTENQQAIADLTDNLMAERERLREYRCRERSREEEWEELAERASLTWQAREKELKDRAAKLQQERDEARREASRRARSMEEREVSALSLHTSMEHMAQRIEVERMAKQEALEELEAMTLASAKAQEQMEECQASRQQDIADLLEAQREITALRFEIETLTSQLQNAERMSTLGLGEGREESSLHLACGYDEEEPSPGSQFPTGRPPTYPSALSRHPVLSPVGSGATRSWGNGSFNPRKDFEDRDSNQPLEQRQFEECNMPRVQARMFWRCSLVALTITFGCLTTRMSGKAMLSTLCMESVVDHRSGDYLLDPTPLGWLAQCATDYANEKIGNRKSGAVMLYKMKDCLAEPSTMQTEMQQCRAIGEARWDFWSILPLCLSIVPLGALGLLVVDHDIALLALKPKQIPKFARAVLPPLMGLVSTYYIVQPMMTCALAYRTYSGERTPLEITFLHVLPRMLLPFLLWTLLLELMAKLLYSHSLALFFLNPLYFSYPTVSLEASGEDPAVVDNAPSFLLVAVVASGSLVLTATGAFILAYFVLPVEFVRTI